MKSDVKIDGVEVLSLEIKLYGERENNTEIDLGGLTLSNNGREYILDVVQSFTTVEGGFTTIRCELERDNETFPDCKYDLTATDLMSYVKPVFYINSELEIENMTLFVKNGNMTKAINVIAD